MSRCERNRTAQAGLAIGLILLALVLVVAVAAPVLFSAQADVLGPRFASPSGEHLLGTDAAGHDVLLRSLVAARLTVLMTAAATAVAVVLGVFAGTGVWLLRPRGRELSLRVIDAMVAFPGLLLALVVAAVLGAGAGSAVVAIGVAGIPYFARLTANLAARISQQEYVSTARLLGVGPLRVAVRHMLPNMAEPLLVLAASTFATTLTAISALSFVGLGVQAPAYDWGKLLNEALPSLLAGRPAQLAGPAVLIVLAGLGAVLIGDGLAARANPRAAASRARASASAAAAAPAGDFLVEVRDLRISAGDRELVKGISFDVRDGEVVGIVGESGSGKTLTAMALAQLLPDGLSAKAARLSLADLDLAVPVAPARMAEAVSLVYQDPGSTFNPALRMGTQLTEVLRVHRRTGARAARERIIDALRAVRLTEPERRMRQHPHELSGGMRQRAMIATSLATQPRLLIADEPTTALDVTVQAEILRELRRLNRREGMAILVISHDIGVVRALCDRVVVMYHGEVVEEVAAADLTVDGVGQPYTKALLEATPELDHPVKEPVHD
ncbi:dipeptide/oligopeptide/nickel ABC transporter permease/ATP-binding protein [Amycolatopsis australiensis]|uniref:ABC-type dipeptide/oligopeptide/nickel transport system, ATPase component n=1 Tax=Amycolatopsis australiensis TaxID=546364 RepID=A0A1K1S7L9_9PSEU|nr:dipeptide/oligopeptide/nickel ABC transporter permease/ATP-binding protein [Amycolatopsis australiensis]SFW80013.1 ABC-type dipeptide/oligopeptide/nickel transport system, ATPase component [Amycolatopsis australiensis]